MFEAFNVIVVVYVDSKCNLDRRWFKAVQTHFVYCIVVNGYRFQQKIAVGSFFRILGYQFFASKMLFSTLALSMTEFSPLSQILIRALPKFL